MMRKTLVASLVLIAACAGAPPPARVTPALRPPAPAAAQPEDPLVVYAREHRAEVERLSRTSQHYVAHDQTRPRGFKALRHGQRVDANRVHHARMIAFDYNAYCGGNVVGKDGTLCEGAVYPGADLTPAQLARASEILRLAPDPATWRARPSIRCFEPHHAVVLFDDHDVPLAEIDVCFECGNFTLTSVPNDQEGGMTESEGMFFADTCRAQNVGGCPPAGSYRMPDLPPSAEIAQVALLTGLQQSDYWRRWSLAEPHEMNESKRLVDLGAREHRLLCSWFTSATRRAGYGLECEDGRRMVVQDDAECLTPFPRGCEATIGDLAACMRSRLETYCSVDAPACVRTDACQKGVRLLR